MIFPVLGIFFGWTWFIWAFVFVFCLVSAIKRSVQEASSGEDKNSAWPAFWAALSFAVILGGMASLFAML